MTRSLRARFALVALATALAAAVAVGLAVQGLFERHVEREMLAELDADLRFLGRNLAMQDGAATIRVQPLPDPRFQEPLSGLYWQVRDDATGALLRSPSLGGWEFPLQADALRPGERHRHIVLGPEGTKLIVLERRIDDAAGASARYRVAVAMDRKLLEAANRAFLLDLLPALAAIAAGLGAAFALQGAIALWPIRRARQALRELRAGRRARLGQALPSELGGLADDFDALLDAQRQSIRLARERAAELAHGLRTPLALLNAQARALRERGEAQAACALESATAGMEARITRELARAQIRGPAPLSGPVLLAPVVARIVGALARMAGDDTVAWRQEIPAGLTAPLDEGDLVELIGTLLENAARFARSDIRVAARSRDGSLLLLIEDDGPGIPPQDRPAALARGVRLDAERGGTGLGLAIADDIVRAYGGDLQLEDGAAGGLCVRIVLPAQSGTPPVSDRPAEPRPAAAQRVAATAVRGP
ncbi:sensor histidine kinase [Falsiroseomonas bella]|uniref:histidine kinase n=1 Tax=Falsiroseomonas bella TaxID=2184016 RepID=A0A317FIG0_9PROT|nr:HAMP domain-containing sensor histidine kinase [Falsiroseomonas bella]PWS38535.1 sensor histidine kinase [Falsiroseomonas bella]